MKYLIIGASIMGAGLLSVAVFTIYRKHKIKRFLLNHKKFKDATNYDRQTLYPSSLPLASVKQLLQHNAINLEQIGSNGNFYMKDVYEMIQKLPEDDIIEWFKIIMQNTTYKPYMLFFTSFSRSVFEFMVEKKQYNVVRLLLNDTRLQTEECYFIADVCQTTNGPTPILKTDISGSPRSILDYLLTQDLQNEDLFQLCMICINKNIPIQPYWLSPKGLNTINNPQITAQLQKLPQHQQR